MLSEKDIVPGRHYLCRVPEYGPRLLVLEAGSKLEWRTGRPPASAFVTIGKWHGTISDGVQVLRELDLEALARGDDKQRAIDHRAMLDQIQRSYSATLASLECAKEHARQALGAWRAHGGPETTPMHVDGFIEALEAIVDGDPLPPPPGPSAVFSWDDVTEARYLPPGAHHQASTGVTLTHGPTGESVTRSVSRSYHENLHSARAGLVSRVLARGISLPDVSPNESALVDEIAEGVERALGGEG